MSRPKLPAESDLPPIHTLRGQRVVLDGDLARLYGATTTAFNQAIRRNLNCFPSDFVFESGLEEHAFLTSQIVTSNRGKQPASPSRRSSKNSRS